MDGNPPDATAVPRGFTCADHGLMLEHIGAMRAMLEGGDKRMSRVEGKVDELIEKTTIEVVERIKANGLRVTDIAVLKSQTKQTAATVAAVVAFLVGIGGQLAIKYLLG